jgi:ATP-dependent exoDNAse (exonuclease V) beta subunit
VRGPDKKSFDPAAPLRDRSVLCLPYPFGNFDPPPPIIAKLDKDKEVMILDAATESEQRRLLYVGMTRARESLILAFPEEKAVSANTFLGAAVDKDGAPLVSLPTDAKAKLRVGDTSFICESLASAADFSVATSLSNSPTLLLPVLPTKASTYPLYAVAPSMLEIDKGSEQHVTLGTVIKLGPAITPARKIDRALLGNAVHAFLGADDSTQAPKARFALAANILTTWNCESALSPNQLLECADRLEAAIKTRWPLAKSHREYPVLLSAEGTRLPGSIDRLVMTQNEIAVIDHKTASLQEAELLETAIHYGPQLAAYAVGVGHASPKAKVSTWLHLPLSGLLCEVVLANEEQVLTAAIRAKSATPDPAISTGVIEGSASP